MRTLIFALFLSAVFSAGLTSCYYDNEEDLYPFTANCDTSNVTYTSTIAPMLSLNCTGCHSTAAPSAGVILDNYTEVAKVAADGRLWGSMNHLAGYKPMPQSSPKLSDCNLLKMRNWLDKGHPNN